MIKKRILAMLLAVSLVLPSALPASAAEPQKNGETVEVEQGSNASETDTSTPESPDTNVPENTGNESETSQGQDVNNESDKIPDSQEESLPTEDKSADQITESTEKDERYKVILDIPQNGTLSFPIEMEEIQADENDPWTPMEKALKQQEELEKEGQKTELTAVPNEEVTLYVSSDYGYQMTSLQAVSEKTNEVLSNLEADEEGKVVFQMPAENIRIQANFQELDPEDPEKIEEEKKALEEQEAQAAANSAPKTMMRSAVQPRKSIYLYVPSSKLWYGSYNTRYYTTNEGKYAYCIEPRRKAPKAGYYSASVMYNTNVRKAAYYAYGGPGYSKYRASYGNIWDGTQKNEYVYSHIIISYIYAKYYLGSNSEANYAFYGLSSSTKNQLIAKANNLLKLAAPPSGYTCYTMSTSYTNGNRRAQAMLCQTYNYGYLNLKKVSSNTAITNGNDMYSLNGAQYGVYSNSACTSKVGTLTTNANGVSNTLTLNPGTYYIKETKAPLGYELSKTVTTAVVPDSGTKSVTVSDKPIDDPAAIVIKKLDRITGEEVQGGASLAGAQFTVNYYDGLYSKTNLPTSPTRTWVIETKELKDGQGNITYRAGLSDTYKVSGDALYKVGNFVTIPRGTVTIQETKAPEGYENNLSLTDQNGQGGDDLYLVQIQNKGDMSSISGGNVFEGTDTVMRGDFSFTKKNGTTNKIMPNIPFKITNVASGEAHTVYTDENGYFSSQSSYVPHSQNTNNEQAKSGLWFGDTSVLDDNEGALPFGEYSIEELRCSTNTGLKMYKGKFTIDQNGMVWEFGTIVNSQIEISTQVIDTTTGSSTIGSMNDEYGYVIGDEINIDGLSTGYAELKLKDKATGEYIKGTDGKDLKVGGEISEGYASDGLANLGLEVPTEVLHTLQGKTIVACVRVYALNSNGTPNYDKLLGAHEDLDDVNETLYFPSLETTMTEKSTSLHDVSIAGASVLEDTVKVKNIPARFYELESSFIYKFVGTLVDQNGNPVKGTDGKNITTSTAVKQMANNCFDQTFTLTYNLPELVKQKYAGQTLHSFVELWGSVYGEQDFLSIIAFERDVKNPSQTISLPIIESTRVSKDILTSTDNGITDEVVLKGLTKENWYTVEGEIVDKSTGKLITQTRTITYGKDDFDYQYAIPGEGANYSVTQNAAYGTIFQTENGYFRLNEDELYIFCESDGTQLGTKTLTRDEFESELFPGDTFEEKRPLSVQYTFVANAKDDTKQVKFTFDVDALRGKSYVVTEKLYHGKGKNAVILERPKAELMPGPLFNKAVKDDYASVGYMNTIIFTDMPLPDGVNATDLSASQNGAVWGYFDENSNYIITSDQNGTIVFNSDSNKMFSSLWCSTILFNNIDTAKVTTMESMFENTYTVNELNVSNLDTSNVTNMKRMFKGSYNNGQMTTVIGLENLDTIKVMTMESMFEDTQYYEYALQNFDTSNVTDMSFMFRDCSSLTSLDLSSFDTRQITSMSGMFDGCRALTTLNINNFDTSNVTDMGHMFSGCSRLSSLDLSSFDTSNVTDMNYMFSGCSELTSLDLSSFDTRNVMTMRSMFEDCSRLTRLDLSNFDTSKVTDMNYMFSGCFELTSLDLTSFDTSATSYISNMFEGCSKLKTVYVTPRFDNSDLYGENVFNACESIVGGTGVKYNPGKVGANMANYQTGYFTYSKNVELVSGPEFNSLLGLNKNTYTFKSIVFENKLIPSDVTTTDLSLAKDKSILGYISSDGLTYHVTTNGNQGNIIFNKDCSDMFKGFFIGGQPFSAIEHISFNNIDTKHVTNMYCMFYGNRNLLSLDISGFNTNSVTNMGAMFLNCVSLTSLDISKLDTSSVTNMSCMFFSCSGLTSLDLSSFNTRNVTNMSSMFESCSSLTSLDLSNFNTSNVTDMNSMFDGCSGLTNLNLSSFDTHNVTKMSSMFESCFGLTSLDLSSFDTCNVTKMNAMFFNCYNMTNLDVSMFNTSNVTNMKAMFSVCSGLSSLDVTKFDTSNVINMTDMFSNCSGLTSLDLSSFNTRNVTNMSSMFESCSSLTSLDLSNFNTSNVTDMNSMFDGCSGLTNLNLSSFDTHNVTDMSSMFYRCSSLTSLDLSNFENKCKTAANQMFAGCKNIVTIDLSLFKFDEKGVYVELFSDCENLKTIYVSYAIPVLILQPNNSGIFKNCYKLVGQSGVTYDSSNYNDLEKTFSYKTGYLSVKKPEYYLKDGPALNKIIPVNCKQIKITNDPIVGTPDKVDDLSYFNMNTISGYLDGDNYIITTNGIKEDIIFNSDSSNMFAGNEAEQLLFDKVNTSFMQSAANMFAAMPNIKVLDLSNFDTTQLEYSKLMFALMSKLTTIYVSEKWDWQPEEIDVVTDKQLGVGIFYDSVNLVGGSGVKYTVENCYCDMANYKTGYFTYKSTLIQSLATTFASSSVGTKVANTVENVKAAEDGATEKVVDIENKETMSPKTAEEKKENPVVSFFSSLFAEEEPQPAIAKVPVNDIHRLDLMDTHNDLNDAAQTFYVADIKTELTNADGEHFFTPNGTTSLTDTVTYSGLKPNQEYTLTGQLINKDTGAVVVEKTVKFTPNTSNGTVTVPFSFNASGMGGVTLVAYETLSGTVESYGTPVGTYVLAEHKDKNDEKQSVTSMSITTSAADKKTNTKMVMPDADAVVQDTVSYKGAVTGQTYCLEATLMQKYKEEAAVDSNGETVTGYAEFIPSTKNGSQVVELSFDATSMPSGEYVVFEKIYAINGDKKELWTTHEDYNDAAQTITITGLDTNIYEASTLTNMAYPKKNMEVHDLVTYTGFQPGQTYTVDWKLVDVATKKDYIDAAGKTVKKTQTFTPDTMDGEFEIVDTFDGSKLNGQNLTAVSTVKLGTKVLFEHNKTLDNEYETLSIPGLDTVASETGTGAKEVYAISNVSITDKITYEKLQVGLEHIVKTSIVDKTTGEILKNSNNEPLTFESEIAPDTADGVYDAVLQFNGKGLAGVKAVVFQEIWLGDTLIAQHKDLNDTDQTFTFKEMPKRSAEVIKRIKVSDFHKEHGNVTFLFKMEGTDACDESHTYYKEITFTEDYVNANTVNGYVEKAVTFEQVPMGTYIVSEEDSARYKLAKVENVKNATVEGKSAKYDLVKNDTASSKFTNIKYEWQGYSDSSIVNNHIH